MALENNVTMAVPNNTLAGVAHGLTHNGSSRTPDFVVVMANQGNTAVTFLGSYTLTYDSVTVTLGTGVAHLGVTIGLFCKRCHTVEDRGAGSGVTL